MNHEIKQIPDAIILLGRGGYSSVPQEYLTQLVQPVQLAAITTQVHSAFIDQGEPSLLEALQSCTEAGARRILIQPVYLPGDRNLHRWIGKVIMRWHQQWTGQAVELLLAEPLGEQPALGAALIAVLQDAPATALNILNDPPEKWDQDPAGWTNIPEHRYHVFFCRGPRCTALGADKISHHLREQLKTNKLLQDDRVLTAQSGCLYPCNQGPVMVVYPDSAWYGKLDEAAIDHIVQEHFINGHPVADYRYYPETKSD